MLTHDFSPALARVFSELVLARPAGGIRPQPRGCGPLALARQAGGPPTPPKGINGGATIAAHAQHVRYGLSLFNRWAAAGGNPFADARWDEAWKISRVDEREWHEIRGRIAPRVAAVAPCTRVAARRDRFRGGHGALRQRRASRRTTLARSGKSTRAPAGRPKYVLIRLRAVSRRRYSIRRHPRQQRHGIPARPSVL